jgi:acetone carboxylase gamma subunit
MAGTFVKKAIDLYEVQCVCGLPVLVATHLYRLYQEEAKSIYCSEGHSFHLTETKNKKLKNRIDALEGELAHERAQREAAEEAAMKETKERMRIEKRINAGLCPHCTRSFKNLKKHFESKHCGPKEAKRVADEMKKKRRKAA